MTPSLQLDLDRRVQWIAPADAAAGTPKTINILSAARMLAFCSRVCWSEAAEALAAELELVSTYPKGTTVPCSRCSADVDRSARHVCFTLAEMIYASTEPRVAHCTDDKTWAVLCYPACASSASASVSAAVAVPAELVVEDA